MKLFLNGSDIRQIVIADLEDGILKKDEVDPSSFLRVIDEFVKEALRIEEIHVIIGPGSATALRTTLSIVNTLQFAMGIPVYGYEWDGTDEALLEQIVNGTASAVECADFLRPAYAQAPKITKSNKDNLKR